MRFRYVAVQAAPHVEEGRPWFRITIEFSVPTDDGFRLSFVGHAAGEFDSLEDALRDAFRSAQIGKHAESAIPEIEPAIAKLVDLFGVS